MQQHVALFCLLLCIIIYMHFLCLRAARFSQLVLSLDVLGLLLLNIDVLGLFLPDIDLQ